MEHGSKDIDASLMLESMTESVLITTANFEFPGPFILYVNAAFERMTGWTRSEILGKSPRILQGPKTDHAIFNDLQERLTQGKVWQGRTVNYRKDGSEFHMQWSITPITNQAGIIYQYLAVQRDVSEMVHTQEKLRQAMDAEILRTKELEETNAELNRVILEQKKTLNLFTKYVPEAIVKKALASRNDQEMVSEELEASLLFCDIRGFTALIEGLSPDQVVTLLNIYYSAMTKVVSEHQGVINQFVGDEIFVAFGAPTFIKEPQLAAVHCAISMIRKLKDINRDLRKIIPRDVVVGIGINFGPVIAGNLGSEDRLSYSITGSEVVTAKRIESLTAGLENTILISASIYEHVKDAVITKAWGKVDLKGKNEKIDVYQVVSNHRY